MKKETKKKSVITVLLLLLGVGAQFLQNASVYLSEPLVCAVLLVATLSCGYLWGGCLALLLPLTGWLISNNAAVSKTPLVIPCLMLANVLFISLAWLSIGWLGEKMPKTERTPLSDDRFRLVFIIGISAAALWAGLTTAFISALSDLLQMESVSPLLIVSLIAISGTLAMFIALWALVCRFPKSWPLIAGGVLASAAKFLVLWLLVSRTVLPANEAFVGTAELAFAQTNYGVPQLFTALAGSALAFLLYKPLKKSLNKEQKK